MDSQLCSGSSLPHILAIEALACSYHAEASLLLDLIENLPEKSNDIGKNATELMSLKFLEGLVTQGACANSVSSALSKTVRLDPSEDCKRVLGRILNEISLSYPKPAELAVSKWDLDPFIAHKRSNLPKCALAKLKDAILTGSHAISESLKEQSGLLDGGHTEHQTPENDHNCNRAERSDKEDAELLPTDLLNGSLPVNEKTRASEGPAEHLCTTHMNPVNEKHDVISNEHIVGEQIISSGEGERFGVERKTNDGNMGPLEPPKHGTNECTLLGRVENNEVLPCEKQVPHSDNEQNNKSEQHNQDGNIKEGGKYGIDDLNENNQVEDKFHGSDNTDGKNDGKADIAMRKNASLGPHWTSRPDSLETTNSRNKNMLAATSEMCSQVRFSSEEESFVEVMRQNGFPGDGDKHCNASKGFIGTEGLNEQFDVAIQNRRCENAEYRRKGSHRLISTNEDIDNVENVPRIVPTIGETEEDLDISSDDGEYHDEWATIDTQKKMFLSSQCTYSEDSSSKADLRELHRCMKCDKGGNVLPCISDSCSVVIHESCLASDTSFDIREPFRCPFCAYSQAISKHKEVKKCASLARKDLTTFICMGPQNKTNKQPEKLFREDGNCLEQNDCLPKGNELNQTNDVEKTSNHECRKKLEFGEAGPSELPSDYSTSFGRKLVASAVKLIRSPKLDNQDGKRRDETQPSRGCKRQGLAVKAVEVSETGGSKKHTHVRSKKGVPRPPEADLPCERKRAQSSQSTDAEEISEDENEDSGASKYFTRVRKQKGPSSYAAIPQFRRKRLRWSVEEENVLKEGFHKYCSPHDKIIPWKRILEYGEHTFQRSRTTMDLRDKWRNICKASPKPK